MKNIFKIAFSTIALACTLAPVIAFPDVDNTHWAAKEIAELSEKGVIVGYPDGTFKPDDNVTRAEFATMAIKALGQEHTTVAQPINFADITPTHWAYNDIQRAVYFDLISNSDKNENFRPDDSVSRAESITVAVNALTTESISPYKAKEVLAKKYSDTNEIPEYFLIPAGKAEILDMLVTIPSQDKAKIEATRPATRAEVAAILYEMVEQAKLNPNAKLSEAMRKKTGDGYVIEEATVQGSIGTIPAGAIIPVELTSYISSQSSQAGELYVAKAPQNYITKEKFILVREGANLKGQLLDVRPGKWFIRNGVLVLDNSLLVTNNDQTVGFHGIGEVKKDRNWFMKFVRWAFKGEKLNVPAEGIVYVKLMKPVKVDLTNGWVIE